MVRWTFWFSSRLRVGKLFGARPTFLCYPPPPPPPLEEESSSSSPWLKCIDGIKKSIHNSPHRNSLNLTSLPWNDDSFRLHTSLKWCKYLWQFRSANCFLSECILLIAHQWFKFMRYFQNVLQKKSSEHDRDIPALRRRWQLCSILKGIM